MTTQSEPGRSRSCSDCGNPLVPDAFCPVCPVPPDRTADIIKGRVSSSCTVGAGFPEACQEPGKYAALWTDNGDEGLLCERHVAVARALPNGPSLHLRTAAPARTPPGTGRYRTFDTTPEET